jgi:hypothetical protein
MSKVAKDVYAKFQLSGIYPDELRQYFNLFSRKFQDIFNKNFKISNSEKSSKSSIPKSIFYQNLSHLAFLQIFQK